MLLIGKRFIKALLDAGIIKPEDNAYRVVIDVRVDNVVEMHVMRRGDERLLEIVHTLEGIAVQRVEKEGTT